MSAARSQAALAPARAAATTLPGRGPLRAARATIAGAYAAALMACALLFDHPLVLGTLLVVLLAANRASGARAPSRRTLLGATVALLAAPVLVNVLVSRQGLTVFARLGDWGPLGQENLTVQALLYGLLVGLRLIDVTLACVLLARTADADDLLRASRRVWPSSALTASLTARLVPVLAVDAQHLAQARRCRADAGPDTAATRLLILRATIVSALDRSLDVAAALETRGYGAGRRPPRSPRPFSRQDIAFAASALALFALAIAAAAAGVARFDTYPLIHSTSRAATASLSALLAIVALTPFAVRRGVVR